MEPVNEFRKSVKEARFVNEPTKLRGPAKKFTLKSMAARDTSFVIEEGTVETKELFARYKYWSESSDPIDEGKVPVMPPVVRSK
jgi:hypothetical protein